MSYFSIVSYGRNSFPSPIYLSPNKAVIAAKSNGAAELELVTVPLTVDRNAGIVTFVLSEG